MFRKISLIILIGFISYISFYFLVPNVSKLKKESPQKTTFMEYREREWREKGRPIRIRKTWIPLSRISPYLIKAVIIAEDDKFWSHEGFDFEAIQKALEKDLKARKFKVGGSTISQQLAKNLFLTPTKNPWRKLKEAVLTWRIERTLTKRRIIELYLNVVEWGEGIFGIEAAARHYFGKSAAALGPEEAARLAVVLPNPRKFNPLGNSRYVAKRAAVIHNIMVKRGIVIPAFEEVMNPEPGYEKGNSRETHPVEKGDQGSAPPFYEPSRRVGEENGLDSKI
ncbi:MAG: monofunctional biosynthetic peptidoglycan transglycosylase [Deltaproteobacteria bacterium RBG_13_43_22]|nr:MAG: monofunctional biosynthetic peptidoglycan transglycosylase [Deltaproteobacteria bacterium RBG_13_43_22]